VPVLPPAQIANLPPGKVLLIRRGLGPIIGRAQMAWRRRDVRAAAFVRNHPVLVAGLSHCTTGIQALVAGGYARAAALLGATAAPLHVAYIVIGRAVGQAAQPILRRLRGRPEQAPSGPAPAQPSADGHEPFAPWSAEAWQPVDADQTSSGAASEPGRRNGTPVDDAWRPR
jgi:hypothetical protein